MQTLKVLILSSRSILELIYFISGIIIAITAIIALKQIALFKKSIVIQSKRDALKLTSEQCSDYCNRIIPLQNILNNKIDEYNISYFKNWEIDIDKNSISAKHSGKPDTTNLDKLASPLSDVLNSMEAFSTYFVSEVADELVAYNTIGLTFLHTVRKLMPFIISSRKDGYFKNLTNLFSIWEIRNIHNKLNEDKKKLEENLQKTLIKYTKPIGTE